MTDDPILLEIGQNGIAVVTLNRPEVRNALNWAAMEQMAQVVEHLWTLHSIRVVLITGAGHRSFCAGADIRSFIDETGSEDGLRQHDIMSHTLDRLASLPVPVIAAMEGATRGGGCEIALAADLRVAANDATIGFSHVMLGLSPAWGGARRLYTLLGYKRAMDVLLTGRVITALEAEALGLVNRTAAPGQALKMAMGISASIAESAPLAIRGIKQVMRGYHTLPQEEARTWEREVFGQLWGTSDHTEAAHAFLEKRKPIFHGE